MITKIFDKNISKIAVVLIDKKADLPDMTGLDWAYEHNWVSEEEIDKAREKEIVLNIWRGFAFIIISDLKRTMNLIFLLILTVWLMI